MIEWNLSYSSKNIKLVSSGSKVIGKRKGNSDAMDLTILYLQTDVHHYKNNKSAYS